MQKKDSSVLPFNEDSLKKCGDILKIWKKKQFKMDGVQFPESFNIPPCQSELRQYSLRTAYVAKLWRNSHLQIPTTLSPIEHGWKECDGM